MDKIASINITINGTSLQEIDEIEQQIREIVKDMPNVRITINIRDKNQNPIINR